MVRISSVLVLLSVTVLSNYGGGGGSLFDILTHDSLFSVTNLEFDQW